MNKKIIKIRNGNQWIPIQVLRGENGQTAYEGAVEAGYIYTEEKFYYDLMDISFKYSPDNPPPYPVLSVNGKTGIIELNASDLGIGTVFSIKGPVESYSDLPSSNNNPGDIYYVIDERVGYLWTYNDGEGQWHQLGMPIDLSSFQTKVIEDEDDFYTVKTVEGALKEIGQDLNQDIVKILGETGIIDFIQSDDGFLFTDNDGKILIL